MTIRDFTSITKTSLGVNFGQRILDESALFVAWDGESIVPIEIYLTK